MMNWVLSNRKKWTILLCSFAVVLAASALWLLNGHRDTNPNDAISVSSTLEPTEVVLPVETPASVPLKPITIQLDTVQPHTVWQNQDYKIYVEQLRLYSQRGQTESKLLLEWDEAQPAQAWVNGDYVVIGVQLRELADDDDFMKHGSVGRWIVAKGGEQAALLNDSESSFGPQLGPMDLLRMAIVDEPSFFITTFKVLDADRYVSLVFNPERSEWRTVERGPLEQLAPDDLTKKPEVIVLHDSETFELDEGRTVIAYQDGFDSLVYTNTPVPRFMSYQNMTLEEVKPMKANLEERLLAGRFRSTDGSDRLIFVGADTSFEVPSTFWEREWRYFAYEANAFVHVGTNRLEVLQYPDLSLTDMNHAEPMKPKQFYFDTGQAKLLANDLSGLTYELDGVKSKLTWFDLLHAESDQLQDLWLTELQNAKFIENVERPPYEEDFLTVTVPILHEREANTNEEVPEKLLEALQEKHPDGDYGSGKTFRKIGGSWYVLLDRYFMKYEEDDLTEMGEMPVSVSVSISEGFGGHTARDFIRQDESWIVADTEGSRVLKLNDELEILDEVAIATPYKLTANKRGLYVDSLGRTFRVNEEWSAVTEAPSLFPSTTNDEQSSLMLRTGDYLEDSETGLTWYYADGLIYQYRNENQTYRSFFVGYNENFPGSTHLIRMEKGVLVLMDRRVDRFDSEGSWLGRIEFPRSRPDGIYDSTSSGENSYVLDEEQQMLYLVQGYRILAIDLQAGQYTEVFRQNYGDIGQLYRSNEDLYFLFHSYYGNRYDVYHGGEAARERVLTEVVKLSLDGGTVKRYYVDTFIDNMILQEDISGQPAFVLTSYSYQ